MAKFGLNEQIEFLEDVESKLISKSKFYTITEVNNYRKNNKYITYLTVKDDKGEDFKFKLSENFKIAKREHHWLKDEYEITKLMESCVISKSEINLLELIRKFDNISQTSNDSSFKNFDSLIKTGNYTKRMALIKLDALKRFIESKAERINLIFDDFIYEPEVKESESNFKIDSIDYERIVMRAFRNGEQDKFGY